MLAALLLAAILPGSAAEAADGAIDALRAELETEFRRATGLGFLSFGCDERSVPGADELRCEAVDEEGDRFFYRLWSGDGERPATSVVWQPVAQLDTEGLTWLRAPTDRYLEAFARHDWPALRSTLTAAFGNEFNAERLAELLRPLRDAAGEIGSYEPVLYNAPSQGRHALEYRIAAVEGELLGRFRIAADEAGNARVEAFLMIPEPGSPLAIRSRRGQAASVLGALLGQPVAEVRVPLARLGRAGDSAEGEVVLEDGSMVAVRAAQVAPTTDFDGNDYRFQVLEAEWLIRSHLVAAGRSPSAVECPRRVVPDGDALDCAASIDNGTSKRFRLLRRGGDHRLVEVDDDASAR